MTFLESQKPFRRSCPRVRTARHGAVIILMVVLLPVLLIAAAFAINLSYMELARTEMQITSDAASRAACRTLARTADQALAVQAAKEAAIANPVAGKVITLRTSDVVFGVSLRPDANSRYVFTPGVSPSNAVRVTLNAAASGSMPLPMRIGASGVNFRPSQISAATQAELDISLVVDRSGSMAFGSDEPVSETNPPRRAPPGWAYGAPAPPGSRWLEAVVAVNDFLTVLETSEAQEAVCLTTYDTEALNDVPLTSDYQQITDALNVYSNAFDEGATNIGDGIGFGVNNLISSPARRDWAVRVMVVLTDGIHNWGPDPLSMTNYAKNKNVVIYTITFSMEADQQRMQDVADAASGRHYHATDMASLRTAFQDIARNLPVLLTE